MSPLLKVTKKLKSRAISEAKLMKTAPETKAKRHRPTVVTVGSTKGGTGKTTTLLNLAELLARHARVLVVDLHYDNPQHKNIFGGKKPQEWWLDHSDGKIEPCYNIRKIVTPGSRTEVYKKRESDHNISFIFLDPARPMHAEYGLRRAATEKAHKGVIYTEEQQRRIRYTLPLFSAIASSGLYDCVLVDTDAGNTDNLGSIAATLHRAVDGYTEAEEEAELKAIYRTPKETEKYEGTRSPLLDPIQEAFGEETPFQGGYRLIVTNMSKADILTIKNREDRFVKMGENNHYIAIVNQCPQRIHEDKLRKTVEKLLPENVFGGIYFLPRVEEVGFGNITDTKQHLTTMGDATDQRLYAAKLKKVSDMILRTALRDI